MHFSTYIKVAKYFVIWGNFMKERILKINIKGILVVFCQVFLFDTLETEPFAKQTLKLHFSLYNDYEAFVF